MVQIALDILMDNAYVSSSLAAIVVWCRGCQSSQIHSQGHHRKKETLTNHFRVTRFITIVGVVSFPVSLGVDVVVATERLVRVLPV